MSPEELAQLEKRLQAVEREIRAQHARNLPGTPWGCMCEVCKVVQARARDEWPSSRP
jgi:hypothetical protein